MPIIINRIYVHLNINISTGSQPILTTLEAGLVLISLMLALNSKIVSNSSPDMLGCNGNEVSASRHSR